MKCCSRCRLTKPADQFRADRKSHDGVGRWCKACHQAYYTERRQVFQHAMAEAQASAIFLSCFTCRQEKPLTEFHRNRASKTGWMGECKACSKVRDAAKSSAHRERLAAYRQKHAARRKVQQRLWLQAHPQRRQQYARKRWATHRDRLKAQYRQRYDTDPTAWLNAAHKRRAAKQVGIGALTLHQWREIVALYGGCCAYCHQPVDCRVKRHAKNKLTCDHVVPLSQGGRHDQDNVVPACWACNRAKGTLPALTFLGLL